MGRTGTGVASITKRTRVEVITLNPVGDDKMEVVVREKASGLESKFEVRHTGSDDRYTAFLLPPNQIEVLHNGDFNSKNRSLIALYPAANSTNPFYRFY